jgi:hypothetical protein
METPDKQSELAELVRSLPTMSLCHIAGKIRQNWPKVNFGAVPYLDAMATLMDISQNYYADTGSSVVAYFLSNASSWRGPVAQAVKAELNKRLKASYKTR